MAPATSVDALYEELTPLLAAAGIGHAHDESRDLIAAVLDVQRFWPTMHPDWAVTPEQRSTALRATALRARGAPFAYAVGRAAFRSLMLSVDERVLIPRQETEELVDLILALEPRGTALDVGTGSGAIALALAAEGRFDRVIATDVSLDALAVAERNVDACVGLLRARVELRHGSLLEPVRGERVDVLVSNPPYIALSERADLPSAVRDWEPPLALFSGTDGMPVTRAIVAGAAAVLQPGGVLALEVDCRRAQMVADLVVATGTFRDVAVRLDLSGRERFVLARLDR